MSNSWGLSWLNSWANSWGLTSGTATRGGVADYHHYRKRLKKIAKLADERLYGKVKKRVEVLAKQELPKEIRAEVQKIQSTIDFSGLAKQHSQEIHAELVNSLKKLAELLEAAMLKQQNEEEELIIMMLLA